MDHKWITKDACFLLCSHPREVFASYNTQQQMQAEVMVGNPDDSCDHLLEMVTTLITISSPNDKASEDTVHKIEAYLSGGHQTHQTNARGNQEVVEMLLQAVQQRQTHILDNAIRIIGALAGHVPLVIHNAGGTAMLVEVFKAARSSATLTATRSMGALHNLTCSWNTLLCTDCIDFVVGCRLLHDRRRLYYH